MRRRRLLERLPAPVGGGHRALTLALAVGLALAAPMGSAAAPAIDGSAPTPDPRAPAPAAILPTLPSADERRLDPPAAPPPGTTILISQRLGGGPAGGPSIQPSISENGRYVAYTSRAPDIVTGDTNGVADVFVLDRQSGTAVRANLPGGLPVPPGGAALDPSISADGNFVAFTYSTPPSTATTVFIPQTTHVVIWNRTTGAAEFVTFPGSTRAIPESFEPSISGDGRLVAFTSTDGSIVSGDGNEGSDVFVFDRTTRQVTVVSSGIRPTGRGPSHSPAISADGRVVVFVSSASDLIPGTVIPETGVYARTLATATNELVSVALSGIADAPSGAPAISANGNAVAFESAATNLAAGAATTGAGTAVYLRDRGAGTTTRVSVAFGGGAANGTSGQASVSADGQIVAFASNATNLIDPADAGPTPTPPSGIAGRGGSEVYARDLSTGETIRISEAAAGGAGGAQSVAPAVGGNGRYVAFASTSAILVAGDTNELADVFLRDLPPSPVLTPPVLDFGSRAVGVAALPLAATLTNTGWMPATGAGSSIVGPNAADFAVAFDGCIGTVLRRGQSCTVTVSYVPTADGERTATLQVLDNAPGSPRTARLVGGGSLAILEIEPKLGPPGIVAIATGSGFPAGSEVRLSWSRGLTPTQPPIVVGPDGTFRAQVLVFHNDQRGVRDLVASPAGGPEFGQVSQTFLVIVPRGNPPRLNPNPRLDDPPPAIVFRG